MKRLTDDGVTVAADRTVPDVDPVPAPTQVEDEVEVEVEVDLPDVDGEGEDDDVVAPARGPGGRFAKADPETD